MQFQRIMKEGNIWAINETGTIVRAYRNMKEVSGVIGVKVCTLNYRFYHLIPTEGLLYIQKKSYNDIISKDLNKIFYSTRMLNKVKEHKSNKKKYNHVIKYDILHRIVCITPCPFSEDEDRPKVGSVRCLNCRSFVSKNSKTREVFCSFNQFGFKDLCKKQQ